MTKRVQLLGHDAETANAFIGEERELTVDTENDHLRLHDGSTPGGHRVLNRDENDSRYQARSVELDGFLDWEPNERGILARQGPSNYNLLTLEVNPDQLTIENANGFGANPLIGLADEITTDHTWSGAHSFTQTIQAAGGVVGNLVGDTAGTHTGPVVGNVTGNLTGNADGNHTGTFTGIVHAQATSTFADGIIPLSALETAALETLNDAATFVGMITMYSGLEEDLPDNWVICDGTNGTPDLRDRFIVCAGSTYPADSTGGNTNHTHTVTIDSGGAHSHTGSADGHALSIAELPAHTHATGVTDNTTGDVFSRGSTAAASTTPNSIESNSADGIYEGISSSVGSGDAHTHALTIDSGGAHTHTGSAATNTHLPPYYSLAFVMRIL